MNGDLEDMMHPEQITQGDTQTQGVFRRSVFEDAVTVTPSSLRAGSVQSTLLQTPPTTDTFPLLSDTQHHIAARKPYLKRTANALASEVGGRTASGQLVLCQCGCQKDEGGMVLSPSIRFLSIEHGLILLAGTMFILLDLAASSLLWLHRQR
jgi:hypothetical protein